MRESFRRALMARSADSDFVFLTGDLGFGALEPLQLALGPRFVNAGVAEQNMVGVAAGMAKAMLFPWVYSIAPFLYARTFEQIRNDVASHRLPVVLVGNGGGYGYGVMGSTHHALEDYGVLATLPDLRIFVPCFARDVEDIVADLFARRRPAYVRLGRCEGAPGPEVPRFAPWRRLVSGGPNAVVSIGPLGGAIARSVAALPEDERPSLWTVGTLPLEEAEIPVPLLVDLGSGSLTVVEEHVGHGGLGASLSLALMRLGVTPRGFVHRHAIRYPTGRFGSQAFHRRESAIDPDSVVSGLAEGTI